MKHADIGLDLSDCAPLALDITGMTCAGWSRRVKRAASAAPTAGGAQVAMAPSRVSVVWTALRLSRWTPKEAHS